MTATPQLLVDPVVADTADMAASPKFITLPTGNSVVIHATKDATNHRFVIRGQQLDPSGSPLGEEVTFLFARAWGTEPPEFDAVAFGGNRVAIVSLNPFDILAVRDFEARQDGLEVFRRKTVADARRVSGEDYEPLTVTGLDDGNDSLDRTNPAEERDRPEVEWLDGTGDGPVAPGITLARYGSSPGGGRDPDPLANGRRLQVLERYGAI
ncbi:MAG TPA: hypothetical protein EYH07_09560, partial [Kiloniellaceae bacterium]|nr:hypothetical protein [Kiloniellaceae bacterium]